MILLLPQVLFFLHFKKHSCFCLLRIVNFSICHLSGQVELTENRSLENKDGVLYQQKFKIGSPILHRGWRWKWIHCQPIKNGAVLLVLGLSRISLPASFPLTRPVVDCGPGCIRPGRRVLLSCLGQGVLGLLFHHRGLLLNLSVVSR